MRREGIDRIALAYDGADDPSRLGLAREDLPGRITQPHHEIRRNGAFADLAANTVRAEIFSGHGKPIGPRGLKKMTAS